MAHKYEHVSTGNGFSVLNNGVKTAVINQDGTLNGTSVIDDGSVTANKLASTLNLTGKTVTVDALRNLSNVGTAGTGVTAVEYGDGKSHVTVLTLSSVAMGTITGGADQALGALIYTFPAGAHVHEVAYMSVGLTTAGATKTDTPDVGIGSVVGSGVNATLNAVGATSEDYITGQTAADANGTATVAMTAATAGYGVGISLNASGDVKAVYLNAADTWAAGAAGALTADGTVVLKWTDIA